MATFAFDEARCLYCHACEVACAQWHSIPAGQCGFRVIERSETGTFPHASVGYRARVLPGCDRCASAGGSPRCAAACATHALTYL